jgi:hypothetical protein
MRRLFAVGVFILAATPAIATTFKSAGEMAAACRAFAAQPEGYHRTPPGLSDPCRKFLEGFFRTLKDKTDAELKAKAQDIQSPKPAACVRMPDVLTYRDFASRIAAFDAANPALRTGPALDLAQKTLEANFPCPEPERPR